MLSTILVGQIPELRTPSEVIYESYAAFWIRSDFDWEYKDVDSLREIRFGDIQGFEYFSPLMKEFVEDPESDITRIHGDDGLERLIMMISNNRIDTASLNVIVTQYLIKKMVLKED